MPKLAALIRAKYPGAYDSVDDATLEKAIVAKYPQYASLIDNTDKTTAELQAANARGRTDLPSITGFLANVPGSLGRFIGNSVQGAAGLAKLAGRALSGDPTLGAEMNQLLRQAPALAGKVVEGVKARYGSPEAALHTAYTDPVGAAADVSTIAGGIGAGAKLGGAGRLAKLAGQVEEVTNPARVMMRIPAGGLQKTANVVVRGTLRPSKAIREDFGGAKGVADAVLRERVMSEANAQGKLTNSVARAEQMLKKAEAGGTPGVAVQDVATALAGRPTETAIRRADLGIEVPTFTDRTDRIGQRFPQGEIPLTKAQALKREAQDLAFEASKNNLSLEQQANSAIAQALRKGIEQRVPGVAPVNQRSQRLLGAKQAFADAQDRPRALTNFLSVLGGAGGFAGGGPAGAIITPLLIKAMDSPRAGAMLGIGLNEMGNGLNSAEIARALLLARLQGEAQQ